MVFRAFADLFVVHEIPATPIGVCGRHRCFPVVMFVGANSDPEDVGAEGDDCGAHSGHGG